MSLTIEDVARWDPGAVRAVGDAARTRAQISIDTANSLPRFPDWTGPGSEEAKLAIEQTRRALMKDADVASAAARSADAAAVNVQVVKDNLQQVLDTARDCGMVVDPVSGEVRPAVPGLARQNDWHNAKVLQDALKQVLAQADTVDGQLAAAMDKADDVVDVPPEARPIPLPAQATGAEDVEQWWNSLSQKDRERLIEEHPAELGNLNGIPAAARNAINQQVLADDLNLMGDTAAQHGVSTEQVMANPRFYGLSADAVTRYHNALKVTEGLEHQSSTNNPNRPRPVMLWKYEPLADRGQGRAAISIGDPDLADDVSVIVPGTGSSVRDGWLSDGHNDAINLWEQSNAAEPNGKHAVISWMGYDAPDGFDDPDVAAPGNARDGGGFLAADVNGLWVTHSPDLDQHVTVIGHSYGSTTVADAFAQSGMHANDAVLLGCPGTDLASSAADFHVDGGQVYVGSASSDPVSWIGAGPEWMPDWLNRNLNYPVGLDAGLGIDPAGDAFGSVRFDAEVVGSDGLDTNDHSHYYERGSESLRAMTRIATGTSDQLGAEGLLAEARHQPRVELPPSEIDLPLLPPIHLPPVGADIPGSPAIIDTEARRPRQTVTNDHAF
jgi:hypothetical protein